VSISGNAGKTLNTSEGLHEFVCEVARRAGELQLSRYQNPGEIREKAPKDIVTEVDLLCEELMVGAIGERYPEDAILSEERGGEISESGRTWLLDPVDGTANYARGNPLFCACVSVLERNTVTHAAVAVPRLGDLYHASLGGGAYRDSSAGSAPPYA
jgi:fructose-1,6-bisphosphatase/inositol monophosphatase family enzyme